MRSQTWTPLPPPSPQHLSGSPHAPAPSKLHPMSDMDWRFNSYMTVYMLEFPFSQIIPPSPSPSESKSPLYTSVSFLLSCIQGRCGHLIFLFQQSSAPALELILEVSRENKDPIYSTWQSPAVQLRGPSILPHGLYTDTTWRKRERLRDILRETFLDLCILNWLNYFFFYFFDHAAWHVRC